jgi:5-hydroxyisourate hydrolase
MGKLSTHVLDITSGKPAVGVVVTLFRFDDSGNALVKRCVTNADGRCDTPLLEGDALQSGHYTLVFEAGDYFARHITLREPRFIDQVTIAFGIANPDENYHVPLLVSPWSYSTYRGS